MWSVLVAAALAAPPAGPAAALARAEQHLVADEPAAAERMYRETARLAAAAGDRFHTRQAQEGLIRLYVKAGRFDKAVRQAGELRGWLAGTGTPAEFAALDALLGECYQALGHAREADARYAAALAVPTLPTADRLRALQGRAEVAADLRDPAAAGRWGELAAAADAAARAGDGPLRVAAVRHLARALAERGEDDRALDALATLLTLQTPAADPLGRRDTLHTRANLLADRGRLAEAEPLYREAVALQRAVPRAKPIVAGEILGDWSERLRKGGRKAEAAAVRADALAEYAKVLADPAAGDPLAGGPLTAFARMQTLTRQARQFKLALQISLESAGRWSDDPLVDARLTGDRGTLRLLTFAYPQARELLRRAVADLDAADPPDLRTLPGMLVNLAAAELGCDSAAAADPHLARCAELYARYGLPPDPVLAECEYLRGASAYQRGDFAAAMRHFRAGLRTADAAGPVADPVRYNLRVNTALVYKESGDYPDAVESLADAVKALAGFAEPDDITFALIDAIRADLLLADDGGSPDTSRVAAAAKLAGPVLEACRRSGIRSGFLWGTAWHALALDRLVTHKDAAGAATVWRRLADGTFPAEPAPGQRKEKGLLLPRTLLYLGLTAETRGDPAAAAKYYAEADAAQAANPRTPVATRAAIFWALALQAEKAANGRQGRERDEPLARAVGHLERVFAAADEVRQKTFGAAAQRASFYRQFGPMFEQYARLAVARGDADGLLAAVTATRSRTLLDQALAAGVDPRANLAADRPDLLAQEADARRAVSRTRAKVMLLSQEEADTPAGKAQVAELQAAQREFERVWKEIVNADPRTRALLADAAAQKAAVDGLRGKLGPNTGLLAYLIGRKESYALFAAGPGRPVEVFPLAVSAAAAAATPPEPRSPLELASAAGPSRGGLRGMVVRAAAPQPDAPPAEAGDAVPLRSAILRGLVDRYLDAVTAPLFTATRGMVVRPATPQRPAAVSRVEALGDAVLPAALRARIRSAGLARLVVVPDDALHALPLECLALPSDRGPVYALDELPPIAYAPSAAILGVVAGRPRRLDRPPTLLTVGDPAYPEFPPAPPPSPVAPPGREPVVVAVNRAAGTRAESGAVLLRDSLPRLEGTRVESGRVRAFFPSDRVTALEGADATERKVVAAVPGKRVVHLAAHGFADPAFGDLQAAVALAYTPTANPDPADDGMLTLNEINLLKLDGCDLTVLSACVTNVGRRRSLEAGVTLAGGFLSAGARGVVASCWPVSDASTADLMAEFFRQARPADPTPGSYADALKAARLKVRATPGYEAPFHWAAFVYLGMPD